MVVVNADLILKIVAGIKASSGFLDELLVFGSKLESDIFVMVKLVHSETHIKTSRKKVYVNNHKGGQSARFGAGCYIEMAPLYHQPHEHRFVGG